MVTLSYFHDGTIEQIAPGDLDKILLAGDGTFWIDMQDPTAEEEERILASILHVHPLAIEDCQRGKHRGNHLPKVEDFGEYLFIIFNPLAASDQANGKGAYVPIDIKTTQLSAFLFKRILVTHHYAPIAATNYVAELCKKNPYALAKGPDYLFHTIIDTIVDAYNPVLDNLDASIDALEAEIFRSPGQKTMARILRVKKNIMTIRRITVYQREMLNRLSRGEFALITQDEMVYYRNVYDHLVRMSDLTDSYRDMVTGALDAYLSVTSNRLNEIMKVLTIISTIFLPLNFVTGFFGMNFRILPLAELSYGIEIAALVMIGIAVAMIWVFRKRKWM